MTSGSYAVFPALVDCWGTYSDPKLWSLAATSDGCVQQKLYLSSYFSSSTDSIWTGHVVIEPQFQNGLGGKVRIAERLIRMACLSDYFYRDRRSDRPRNKLELLSRPLHTAFIKAPDALPRYSTAAPSSFWFAFQWRPPPVISACRWITACSQTEPTNPTKNRSFTWHA